MVSRPNEQVADGSSWRLPRSARVLAALWFGLSATFGQALAAGTAAPNVVMIISDNQLWTDFGFMGHQQIETPNLDRLATQGLMFTRGYNPMSLCRPSLMTIISGQYPHQHHVVGNDPANLALRAELISKVDSAVTLPRLLAARRYVSHQSGKWWEGGFRRAGFTAGMTRGFPHPGGRHGDDGLRIGRQGLQPVFRFMDQAVADGLPFFLFFAPNMPTEPYNGVFEPPPRLVDKYRQKTDSHDLALYWAMVEWFDEKCGQLLEYLDTNGLSKNTLVVFLSDNGSYQTFMPQWPSRSNRTAYETAVRTPMMFRWPGRIEPREDRTTLVSTIDLAPTILSACGLRPTAEMAGTDVLNNAALQQRPRIYGEIFSHDIVDIDDPAQSLVQHWCIEGRWKLIMLNRRRFPDRKVQLRSSFMYIPEEFELYDLLDDPQEANNVAAAHPGRVAELRRHIEQWAADQ